MVIVLMTSSCSKNDELPGFGVVVDMMVFITVLDSQGNNHLDPGQEGFYDPRDIKIFYERNGKLEEFYESHLHMRRNFRVAPSGFGRDYGMDLVLSEKTVIQWNEHESDTIQAEIYKTDGPHIRVTKVYFNGELKWDVEDLTGREITIIK